MNIIGLIEMHPFDGSDQFICLRINNGAGSLFDLPITNEQLQIVVANMNQQPQEDTQQNNDEAEELAQQTYEPSNSSFIPRQEPDGEEPIFLRANPYTMGQAAWDEDDDL